MNHNAFILGIILCFFSIVVSAADTQEVQRQLQALQQQTLKLQGEINRLEKQLIKQTNLHSKKSAGNNVSGKKRRTSSESKRSVPSDNGESKKPSRSGFHSSAITIHRVDNDPESLEFYPTALVADNKVVTYIAGTPIVTSPYLGSRPAFDGSDYIVNISSINRDVRLMQQRRGLYRAYESIGYPMPNKPIIAISGKVEPDAVIGDPFLHERSFDATLGAGELDVAAILNSAVEAYISLVYDESPPDLGGQRLSNSSIDLNMGFVNIGNLDKTPLYFTGGQLFVPYGRFSTAMVSAPLTMVMARTKARPFILGYKSQTDTGPFLAAYGFRSDTTLGSQGAGGLNVGYIYDDGDITVEVGGSAISTLNDAGGMQFTGSMPGPNVGQFGGFSSPTNGNEMVKKIPAVGAHATTTFDRYNLTAEWVGATGPFRVEDLSFNGNGAQPQAVQLEAGVTFKAFDKPASVALGYQWTKEALALNLPEQRVAAVFNISIWKDTVESLEYRHDINYGTNQYANGAAPTGLINANTYGPGGASNTVLAQIGVFF